MQIEIVKSFLLNFQEKICLELCKQDSPQKHSAEIFRTDLWDHAHGGGGKTCILENGSLFEKAGIGFSHVYGNTLPPAATTARPELIGSSFQAMGVSIVIHPKNPYIPTTHLNLRFFLAEKKNHDPIWWFGGGFDLTPYYPFEEDCIDWHQHAKAACDPFGDMVYQRYKKWCDDYFFLKHRNEARGIGGLFFDDLNEWPFEKCFEFIQLVGNHFIKAYFSIVAKRKNIPFGEQERDFQLYRRGRYVEFNLLYDRGTLFGLQSGGRTESILMSLPPIVHWNYNWQPEPGSKEEILYKNYLKPRDWITLKDNTEIVS